MPTLPNGRATFATADQANIRRPPSSPATSTRMRVPLCRRTCTTCGDDWIKVCSAFRLSPRLRGEAKVSVAVGAVGGVRRLGGDILAQLDVVLHVVDAGDLLGQVLGPPLVVAA